MIDREFLRSGGLTQMLAEAGRLGLVRLTSPEERMRSRRRLLEQRPHEDIWVFAYGSLMWNPAFHFVEEQPAVLFGYHRRFCLLSPVGRGTAESPGLLLALDRGGACRGIAYRIAAAQVEEELDVIWAREQVADGYRPIWGIVRVGPTRLQAITFAIDTTLATYAGRLSVDETARRIAAAEGALGRCADYLERTVAHLEAHGIHDRALVAVRSAVRSFGTAIK